MINTGKILKEHRNLTEREDQIFKTILDELNSLREDLIAVFEGSNSDMEDFNERLKKLEEKDCKPIAPFDDLCIIKVSVIIKDGIADEIMIKTNKENPYTSKNRLIVSFQAPAGYGLKYALDNFPNSTVEVIDHKTGKRETILEGENHADSKGL